MEKLRAAEGEGRETSSTSRRKRTRIFSRRNRRGASTIWIYDFMNGVCMKLVLVSILQPKYIRPDSSRVLIILPFAGQVWAVVSIIRASVYFRTFVKIIIF